VLGGEQLVLLDAVAVPQLELDVLHHGGVVAGDLDGLVEHGVLGVVAHFGVEPVVPDGDLNLRVDLAEPLAVDLHVAPVEHADGPLLHNRVHLRGQHQAHGRVLDVGQVQTEVVLVVLGSNDLAGELHDRADSRARLLHVDHGHPLIGHLVLGIGLLDVHQVQFLGGDQFVAKSVLLEEFDQTHPRLQVLAFEVGLHGDVLVLDHVGDLSYVLLDARHDGLIER